MGAVRHLPAQLQVKGSFAQVNCFDRSLAMLRSGRVRTDGLITHRFALEEYAGALRRALLRSHLSEGGCRSRRGVTSRRPGRTAPSGTGFSKKSLTCFFRR